MAEPPTPVDVPAPSTSPRTLHPVVRDHALTFSRFAVVGAVKTAVDFATFNIVLLLVTTHTPAVVIAANTLAFTVAAVTSFPMNARFTFRKRARGRRGQGLAIYFGVSLFGLTAYNLTIAAQLLLLHPTSVPALNLVKLTSLGVSLVVNYVGYRSLVFVHPHEQESP